jgi:hypothetical protein
MRLSWYADTGVAVFSIWQGGTCTGTFRLPIADLPRMIEALQRGPHGDAREAGGPHDDPRATEQHSMPDSQARAGHGAGRYAPGDYDSGDYRTTERHDVPGHDLGPEPGTGYSDPGSPAAAASGPEGYGRTAAHGRYAETRAVYPGEDLPGGVGGYPEERGDSYRDEPPTGVYRGDPLSQDAGGSRRPDRRGGHHDDPLTATYRADPHDDPLSGGYGDDPLSAGYRAEPLDVPRQGGYGDDSLPGGYRDEPHGGPYRANSLPGGYRADMRGGRRDDPLSGGYGDDPLSAGYAGDPHDGGRHDDPLSGGYRDDPLPADYAGEPHGGGRRADRHGGDYPDDPLTGPYPGERHTGDYADDPRGGYAEEQTTARYRAEPPAGDYPTGPSDSAIDDPDYPAPPGNTGYSPARPYVAPVPGSTQEAGEGRGARRRGGGQEESNPSPDSFPYGRPSAEPEVRGRRR